MWFWGVKKGNRAHWQWVRTFARFFGPLWYRIMTITFTLILLTGTRPPLKAVLMLLWRFSEGPIVGMLLLSKQMAIAIFPLPFSTYQGCFFNIHEHLQKQLGHVESAKIVKLQSKAGEKLLLTWSANLPGMSDEKKGSSKPTMLERKWQNFSWLIFHKFASSQNSQYKICQHLTIFIFKESHYICHQHHDWPKRIWKICFLQKEIRCLSLIKNSNIFMANLAVFILSKMPKTIICLK